MRRSLLVLTLASLACVGIVPLQTRAQAAPAAAPYRVVVQVSEADPARWNLVLNNVKNLQDDLGASNVAVEIVAYGPGIGMLKVDATTSSRVSDALKAGVMVLACENTMRSQTLARADMHPGVSYVPAGVVAIVKRQREGWAYLRP